MLKTNDDRKEETNAVWHWQYKCSGIRFCQNAAPLIFGGYEVFNRVDPELFAHVPLNKGKSYFQSSVSDLNKKIRENTVE